MTFCGSSTTQMMRVVAGVVGAEAAGIGVGDVAADRAVGDAVLDVAHRVGTAARPPRAASCRMWNARRCALLRADAGQALQLLDEPGERIRDATSIAVITCPGSSCRPSCRPSAVCISSSALRCASLMRREDQVLQHLDVVLRDDLGIDLERLHLLGAVDDDGDHAAAGRASTRSSAICFCRRSCICCACFIICWMFMC